MSNPLATLGLWSLWISLYAFAFSWLVYLIGRGDHAPTRFLGRAALSAGALALLVSAGALMRLIWTRDYSAYYVYAHVSNDLPGLYVFSAFWAGQEGSLLFWAMMAGLVAFALYWRAGSWEAPVLRVYLPSVLALIALTLFTRPFQLTGGLPPDGLGLNPLLRDPWMALHPPVTFLGYATLGAPFAYAMASLQRRSWDPSWVRHALPWALVGWLTMGTGIIMGGFWAYKVLGWGGWWGWDPVENASLLPWLTATALIHGLLLQRIRGKLVKTNIVLAVVTFVLVIYSTYLTRSGALEGASVHSFGTSAVGPWILLWLLATLLYGLARFARAALAPPSDPLRIKGDSLDEPFASREMMIALGAVVLVAIAAVVGLGTSAPILTRLAGQGSAAIDISFYDRATLPLGILLALGLGFSVLLRWKGSGIVSRNALLVAAGAGVIGVATAWQIGIRQAPHMLFAGSSLFALTANLLVFERALWQGGWKQAGGYLAHIGIAFMLVAVVSASAGSKQKVDLPYQTPVRVMGYELTFEGFRAEPENKQSTVIRMQRPGERSVTYLRPKLYQQYGSGQMMTRAEPDIRRRLAFDLYIAPAQFLPPADALAGQGTLLTLHRGQAQEADGVRYTFERFDMGAPHGGADVDPRSMEGAAGGVGARIRVEGPWGAEIVVPRLSMAGDGKGEPAPLPGEEEQHLQLKGIDADNGVVSVLVTTAGAAVDGRAIGGLLTIEISTKPMMTVLWSGVILALLGGCLALWRRARQLPV